MNRDGWSDTIGRDPGPSTLQGALDTIARAGEKADPDPVLGRHQAPATRGARHAVPGRRHRLDRAAACRASAGLGNRVDGGGAGLARAPGDRQRRAAEPLDPCRRARRGDGPDLLVVSNPARQGAGGDAGGGADGAEDARACARAATPSSSSSRLFIILTHFLYSQSLLVALAMLVSVWGLLTAVVLAHMPVGQPSLRQASGLAARTALLGAPVMALLFVLFPRVGPLWGVPQDGVSKTGLSNIMKMGSMSEVRDRRLDRHAAALRRPRAGAVGHVFPRSGADHLRRRRVAAGRPALRAAQPAGAAADAQDQRRAASLRSDARAVAPRLGAAARGDHRRSRGQKAIASSRAKTCSGSPSGR